MRANLAGGSKTVTTSTVARVIVPADLWALARARAALDRRPVQELVADALRAYLDRQSVTSQMTGR